VTIVSPSPVSVEEYASAGRDVEVERPACPVCGCAVVWWSGYWRFVRAMGLARSIFVRRVRCRSCRATTAVLPLFVAERRLDAVDTIDVVVEAVIGGELGVRPAAAGVDVPHETARDWVRRFRSRGVMLAVAFAALVVEVGGGPLRPTADAAVDALAAIGAAFDAACGLPGWAVVGRWRFASSVCGGSLLVANTDPLSMIVGNRCFIPPTPRQGA
jgi:transposase-like protein